MCYRNFINRRGQPKEMYCDRRTNFVGAIKELRDKLRTINHQQIVEKFTDSEMEFVFNSPASPHMGGSWERIVRSVKNTLYGIEPSHTPSDQVLRRYLIKLKTRLIQDSPH